MQDIQWNLIKVLVVDDDKTSRMIMEGFMKSIGCIGAYVEDGEKAVEILKVHNFDICFMDIMMPVMGGIEATQIIRETIDKDLPIIAITGSTMQSDKQLCEDVGMNGYIQKPLQIEFIRDKIIEFGIKNNS